MSEIVHYIGQYDWLTRFERTGCGVDAERDVRGTTDRSEVTCPDCLAGRVEVGEADGQLEIACSLLHDHDPSTCGPDWSDMLGDAEAVRVALSKAGNLLTGASIGVSIWSGWQGWKDHPIDDRHRAGVKALSQVEELADALADVRTAMRRALKAKLEEGPVS